MSMAHERRSIIHSWWREELADDESSEARGLSARLRRAGSILEILSERAVQELGRKLELGFNPEALAVVAGTLAHVRSASPDTLARRFGEVTGHSGEGSRKRETRILSAARMQNVIRAGYPADLAAQLRRTLPLVDYRCNAGRLAADLLMWSHPRLGEDVRARWWFDYYRGAMPSAQDSARGEETQETEETPT